MSETVEKVINEYSGKIELLCSRESTPLGTGGAVKNAMALIDTDYCMIMNGDSFLNLDAARFFDDFYRCGHDAFIALAEVDDVSRYGAVIVNDDNKICSFVEKGKYSGEGVINAGIYLMKIKNISNYFPGKQKFSLENDFFPAIVEANKLFGFVESGAFIDIGIPDSYHKAAEIIGDF